MRTSWITGLRWVSLTLAGLFGWGLWPVAGRAAPTAQEVMTLMQQQTAVPVEFSTGEIFTYCCGGVLHRHYRFAMGRQWDDAAHTETVRLDTGTVRGTPEEQAGIALDARYLLERRGQDAPRQWFYVPAFRQVKRLQSVRLGDRALQSEVLLYDLTTMVNMEDYTYTFGAMRGDALVIEGKPRSVLVPYERTMFVLARHGDSRRLTEIIYEADGHQRHAVWSDYREIAPGHFRPRRIVVSGDTGWTELYIQHWELPPLSSTTPQVFSPSTLATTGLPITFEDEDK